ncbi:TniB protein [Rhodobacter viridis]|uniref:TniB protein n=1 Tax=Rhodobacter viridis TaxID=1054202 RepID=A0A318TMS3_9RHOB|nr:TniB protein [Rhodobacter viridis]
MKRALKSQTAFRSASPEAGGNALLVTVPPEATSKSLAEEVARQTGYGAIAARANGYQAWGIVRHRLRLLGIRLLIIDEAHHLLRPGPGRDILGALQSLKHLLQGEDSTAVILAGVDKLKQGLLQDPETARRFKPFELMRITEGSQDARRFARSMQICAHELGLILPEANFAERVLFAENGDAGLSFRFAKQVLKRTVEAGRDRITLEDARWVFNDQRPEATMTPFAEGDWDMVQAGLIKAGWSN